MVNYLRFSQKDPERSRGQGAHEKPFMPSLQGAPLQELGLHSLTSGQKERCGLDTQVGYRAPGTHSPMINIHIMHLHRRKFYNSNKEVTLYAWTQLHTT